MSDFLLRLPPEEGEPKLSVQQDQRLKDLFDGAEWFKDAYAIDSMMRALWEMKLVYLRRSSRELNDEKIVANLTAAGDTYIRRRLNPIVHFETIDGLMASEEWCGQPPNIFRRAIRGQVEPIILEPGDVQDLPDLRTREYELVDRIDNVFYYREKE